MDNKLTTRDIQMVLLDILKDVHEFCVKHDIKYTLSGGSQLGLSVIMDSYHGMTMPIFKCLYQTMTGL